MVSGQIRKTYKKAKTHENGSFLDIPRMNREIFTQVTSQAKSHDVKLQKHQKSILKTSVDLMLQM